MDHFVARAIYSPPVLLHLHQLVVRPKHNEHRIVELLVDWHLTVGYVSILLGLNYASAQVTNGRGLQPIPTSGHFPSTPNCPTPTDEPTSESDSTDGAVSVLRLYIERERRGYRYLRIDPPPPSITTRYPMPPAIRPGTVSMAGMDCDALPMAFPNPKRKAVKAALDEGLSSSEDAAAVDAAAPMD